MKNWLVIFILLIAPLAACDEGGSQRPREITTADRALSITTPAGDRYDFTAELALTPEEMREGLMNRDAMPPDHGMLFYFGDEAERGFWMKNTYIPLDIIFIKKDGRIFNIHPDAKPLDKTSIRSKGDAAAVLEINGGLAQEKGIEPGAVVHHSFFGNALAD